MFYGEGIAILRCRPETHYCHVPRTFGRDCRRFSIHKLLSCDRSGRCYRILPDIYHSLLIERKRPKWQTKFNILEVSLVVALDLYKRWRAQ